MTDKKHPPEQENPTAFAVDLLLEEAYRQKERCDWCHRENGEHTRQCPVVDPTGRKSYR